jgi:hypothetical protein
VKQVGQVPVRRPLFAPAALNKPKHTREQHLRLVQLSTPKPGNTAHSADWSKKWPSQSDTMCAFQSRQLAIFAAPFSGRLARGYCD